MPLQEPILVRSEDQRPLDFPTEFARAVTKLHGSEALELIPARQIALTTLASAEERRACFAEAEAQRGIDLGSV